MLTATALLAAAAVATCDAQVNTEGAPPPDRTRDVVIGPLALLGGRASLRAAPDAYDGRGWKAPLSIPDGTTVTLSVPAAMRGKVGFSFTHAVERRVHRRSVAAASPSVVLRGCPRAAGRQRSGFPGGILSDRPRCVTLTVRVHGPERRTHRARVPLGHRCGARR